MQNNKQGWLGVLGAILFLPTAAFADISGKVFRDYNANGVRDNTATFVEPYVGGVEVKAYDSNNALVGTQVSAADGSYSFTGLSFPLRIEFTGLPSNAYPSFGANTSVQFHAVATTTADFGYNFPDDYFSTDNPKLAIPVHVNGNPLGGGTSGTARALVRFDYTDSGTTANSNNENIARNNQIGTTWGWVLNEKKTGYLYQPLRKDTQAWVVQV